MLASLSEMLKSAQAGRYAVPNFDIWNSEMLLGVMNAVNKTKSPVILAFGTGFMNNIDIVYYAPMMLEFARQSDMPVAVHWDHGRNMGIIQNALKCGFNSIMIDASANPFDENVRLSKEVVDYCHIRGIPVEAELGHIGPETDYEDLLARYSYTDPDEAKLFSSLTGADCLAVAIGNAHGTYTAKPQINFAIFEKIKAKVDIPLVLHGASGISDADVRRSIDIGVTKVNIHTELCQAAMIAINAYREKGNSYLAMQQIVTTAVEKRATEKIELFGSAGKGVQQ
jgi:ketose-bisphosphate aldolase